MAAAEVNPTDPAEFMRFAAEDDGRRFRLMAPFGGRESGEVVKASDLGPGAEVSRLVKIGHLAEVFGGVQVIGDNPQAGWPPDELSRRPGQPGDPRQRVTAESSAWEKREGFGGLVVRWTHGGRVVRDPEGRLVELRDDGPRPDWSQGAWA
jgi:hypothetical protein